ncbi:MAG: hypothetical protein MZU84_02870 [Sphingobacterium sp.]|nr:hypothetical protein [Sphingobacterium sp.]
MQDEMAIQWEFYTGIAAAAAGAEIICVRHPKTVALLKKAFAGMRSGAVFCGGEIRWHSRHLMSTNSCLKRTARNAVIPPA